MKISAIDLEKVEDMLEAYHKNHTIVTIKHDAVNCYSCGNFCTSTCSSYCDGRGAGHCWKSR